MRTIAILSLLVIWIFVVFAPSTVVLLAGDSDTFVSYSLNEEENKEQEKKDSSEEKLIPAVLNGLLEQVSENTNSATPNYLLGNSNHLPEIPLPPPERQV